MFHRVGLLSQAPLARGSSALPSVMFNVYSVEGTIADDCKWSESLTERLLLVILNCLKYLFNLYKLVNVIVINVKRAILLK